MDLIISQDFFPKIGGAHKWLYEVYKRWPIKAIALVQDYSHDIPSGEEQKVFDSHNHGLLSIERHDLFIDDVNVFNFGFIKKTVNIFNKLKECIVGDTARIHCIKAFPEGIPAILLKKISDKKIKVITYAHGEEILTANMSRQLSCIAKWVYKKSDLIIANSESTKKLLESFSLSGPVEIIHPGVDTESFEIAEKKLKEFKAQFNWPVDTIILTTMARMEPRKNHARVIEAVGDLRKEGLNIAYIIGSDGEEKEHLIHLVNDLNLDKFVAFTGYLNEEERVYAFLVSDIYIMPSVKTGPMIEGYGIVFIEAAAAGIPSIAGNVGGQPEAVLDNRTGLVIDGQNIDEIKNAIRYLAENETIRLGMGKAGRTWAKENDWDIIAKKTYGIINDYA